MTRQKSSMHRKQKINATKNVKRCKKVVFFLISFFILFEILEKYLFLIHKSINHEKIGIIKAPT